MIRKEAPISVSNQESNNTRKATLASRATIFVRDARGTSSDNSPEMTVEDIKRRLHNKTMLWKDVATRPALLTDLLAKAAEEISAVLMTDFPVTLLDSKEMKKRFHFLNGSSLLGLYEYFKKQVTNNGDRTDTMSVIFEQAGIQMSFQDIVKAKELKKRIYWERVGQKGLHELLENVATHLQKIEHPQISSSILTTHDLWKSFPCLKGDNLASLVKYARINRKDESIMTFLRHKAGITLTVDDLITTMQLGRIVEWNEFRGKPLNELVKRYAKTTVNKPTFLWTTRDLKKKAEFLGNRDLSGLHAYLTRDRGTKQTIAYLNEISGLNTSIEDIIWAMKLNMPFWHKVPSETKKELIEKAAQEKGISPIELHVPLLRGRFTFLNGHSLIGLYNYTQKEYRKTHEDKNRNIIAVLIKENDVTVTISDIKRAMENEKTNMWDRVPSKIVNELLYELAKQAKKSVGLLTSYDFELPLDCLGKRSLIGLYDYFSRKNERKGKDIIGYIFQENGIEMTSDDIKTAYETNQQIFWDRVSPSTLYKIFEQIAKQEDIPITWINYSHFEKNFSFLGNRNLMSLLMYAQRQKRDINETRVMWVKKKAGIPHLTKHARKNYRSREMKRSFEELPWPHDSQDTLDTLLRQKPETMNIAEFVWEKFKPLIIKIAETYKRLYADILKDEILNETLIAITDNLLSNPNITYTELFTSLHTDLELYCNTAISQRYKQKSQELPIGNTNLSLKETFSEEKDQTEKIVFQPVHHERVNTHLAQLTPLQREVIWGIITDQRTFAEIAEDVNRNKQEFGLEEDVDGEMLQELFNEGFSLLKQKFTQSQISEE